MLIAQVEDSRFRVPFLTLLRALLFLFIFSNSNGFSQQSVRIQWQSVTRDIDGQPEAQPLYYNVYCDTIPAFYPSSSNFLVATFDTEYVHTDPRLADPNQHLFYRVRAIDRWGNQSADSDTVGETTFVLARIKLLLQAPYHAAGDTMTTALRDRGQISLQSPYPSAARSVTQMPNDVVDWILIQLRDSTSANVIAQESFLLKKDGSVTELDGITQQLGFTGITSGAFQLVVRHRNHVAAMARPLLRLNRRAAPLYDFTIDSTAYFGVNAAKELEAGVWGLWAGDIDQDGLVSSIDYDLWRFAAQQGKISYQPEDLNFDGLVTTQDYILWYRSKLAGVASQVP